MRDVLMKLLLNSYGAVRKTKRKVSLDWLQDQVIVDAYADRAEYEMSGGFAGLARGLKDLETEGVIIPVRSSRKSFKPPFIPTWYWLVENVAKSVLWDPVAMLRLREWLNLSYYDNHIEEQTEITWHRLEQTYRFLQTRGRRETVTREERSLELYGSEKWLAEPEGERFLRSISLSLIDLKALVCREPFVFYCQDLRSVRGILIIENHSLFHSSKRVIQNGLSICGMTPEMLIYGEGWKIISSLLYLEELGIDPSQVEFFYAGDMDLSGWAIYANLKRTYPHLKLLLATPIYNQMMKASIQTYDYTKKQYCKPEDMETVSKEIFEHTDLHRFVDELVEQEKRVPQEVLSYEVMIRMDKE